MEHKGFLSCWQEASTGPYPETDESSLHYLILLLKDKF
jgi:hypothetical protein